ncbi:MAG: hypothetical protein JSV11_07345 [Nitrospiraceae bacterium]|jgi:predicted transcriptional regulator|nr:MAG: hypothetical protein JSU99_07890 [Nitrospiraceae bacterium]UCH44114.1 MAG: hypothetical protein JSV11_07345 [Nitrospiraceae bacterium]
MEKANMKLKEIAKVLDAQFITEAMDADDLDISSACSTDLMSVVLYYHSMNCLLITGLTQPSVIRTAEIACIKCIVFVQGKNPNLQTIELAKEKGIPLLSTPHSMYSVSGRLFQAGLPSSPEK